MMDPVNYQEIATIHENFKDLNGHLAIASKPRPRKHCGVCGEQLPADMSKLEKHCKRHHSFDDGKRVLNEGFLKFGYLPTACKFENFFEYLEHGSIFLKIKSGYN